LFVVWDSDASCPGASYLVAQRANNEQPATKAQKLPFLKYKKYGQHDQSKANQVVPGQLIRFEDENGNEDKHRERNGFLNGFEFEQIERSPVTTYPIRLAGTWKMYSKNASPQLIRMTASKPRCCKAGIFLNWRWPYQAKVMNTFDRMSNRMQ
jgi:hypothetical protein